MGSGNGILFLQNTWRYHKRLNHQGFWHCDTVSDLCPSDTAVSVIITWSSSIPNCLPVPILSQKSLGSTMWVTRPLIKGVSISPSGDAIVPTCLRTSAYSTSILNLLKNTFGTVYLLNDIDSNTKKTLTFNFWAKLIFSSTCPTGQVGNKVNIKPCRKTWATGNQETSIPFFNLFF